ncbi:hypothetical protein FA13DRAFT_1790106 [Coprinellus micaceus]|uniref:Integral membrane protein n=1 Tax=Coprinellus micaceus TaxID=71717 RepID=A0A4Y7TGI2_COPMI|nr:hypothetical protein FA13DRAFT_1790106 [Coprinellus micaceus]
MAPETPRWPSLYNPGLEVLNVEHRPPTQPGGYYLYHARDVFRFTFYWSLILYTPFFLACGAYAFWNYTFPPSTTRQDRGLEKDAPSYEMSPATPLFPTGSRYTRSNLPPSTKLPKINERRSRLAFATIVLLTFVLVSVAGSVLGSVIMGFVVFGLFKAGSFYMSTWIPFLLAVLQVLIGLLSVWPSIIEII